MCIVGRVVIRLSGCVCVTGQGFHEPLQHQCSKECGIQFEWCRQAALGNEVSRCSGFSVVCADFFSAWASGRQTKRQGKASVLVVVRLLHSMFPTTSSHSPIVL